MPDMASSYSQRSLKDFEHHSTEVIEESQLASLGLDEANHDVNTCN
jgi:hypothetical protein